MIKNILGINFNHDGSAAIISEGKITAYVNTERFSKLKKHPGIRSVDLANLLNQAKLTLKDIGVVLLCNIHSIDSDDIKILHGSDLKETWFKFWVNGLMNTILIEGVEIPCVINPGHHTLHNALSFYTSPFDEAMIFSWDPVGYAVHLGRGNKMTRLDYSLPFNASLMYALASESIFGTGLIGAGKTMGLAPYGRPNGNESSLIAQVSGLEELLTLSNVNTAKYVDVFGKALNATLAFNVQQVMEDQLKSILNDLYEIAIANNISPNICLGGGGALNSVANQLAFESSAFKNIFMHPASSDDGTAIGACLWFWYNELNNERQKYTNRELMYSIARYDHTIEHLLENILVKEKVRIERTPAYIEKTANLLADGKVIGWFQGASEIGPRSLGNRSILADPRRADMKDVLNLKVKFREHFRPFAPSVLNEFAHEWFGLKDSPFMLRVCNVLKDNVKATTHVDGTARIQTVDENDNQSFYKLIKCFYESTNVPLILNTSFNIKGKPIVETAEDALDAFLQTQLDALVFNNLILTKK